MSENIQPKVDPITLQTLENDSGFILVPQSSENDSEFIDISQYLEQGRLLSNQSIGFTATVATNKIPLRNQASTTFRAVFNYDNPIQLLEQKGKAAINRLKETDHLLNKLNIPGNSLSAFALSSDKDLGVVQNNIQNISQVRANLEVALKELSTSIDAIDPTRQRLGNQNLPKLEMLLKEKIAFLEGLEAVENNMRTGLSGIPTRELATSPEKAGALFLKESQRLYVKEACGEATPEKILLVLRLLDPVSVQQILIAEGSTPQEAKEQARLVFASYQKHPDFKGACAEFKQAHKELLSKTLDPQLNAQRLAALKGRRDLSSCAFVEINARFVRLHALQRDPQGPANALKGSPDLRVAELMQNAVTAEGTQLTASQWEELFNEAMETEITLLGTIAQQPNLSADQKAEIAIQLANLHALDGEAGRTKLIEKYPATLHKTLLKQFPQLSHQAERLQRTSRIRYQLEKNAQTPGEKVAIRMLFDRINNVKIRVDQLRTLANHEANLNALTHTESAFWYDLYHLQAAGKLTPLALAAKVKESTKLSPAHQQLFATLAKPLAQEAFKAHYSEEGALAYTITSQSLKGFIELAEANAKDGDKILEEVLNAELQKVADTHYFTHQKLTSVEKRYTEILSEAVAFPNAFNKLQHVQLSLKGVNFTGSVRSKNHYALTLGRVLFTQTQELKGEARIQKIAQIVTDYAYQMKQNAKDLESREEALMLLDQALFNQVPIFLKLPPEEWNLVAAIIQPVITQCRKEIGSFTPPAPALGVATPDTQDMQSERAKIFKEWKETEKSFGTVIQVLAKLGENEDVVPLLKKLAKLNAEELGFAFSQVAQVAKEIKPFQEKVAAAKDEEELVKLFSDPSFRQYRDAIARYTISYLRITKAMGAAESCFKQFGGESAKLQAIVGSCKKALSEEQQLLSFTYMASPPIQRLPRHEMLSKEMKKHSPKDSDLEQAATEAYLLIKGSTVGTNNLQRELEGLTTSGQRPTGTR